MAVTIPGVQYRRVEVGGQAAMCQVVHCSSCTNILPVRNSKGGSLMPELMIKKKADQAGWLWDRRGKHVCDKCLAENRKVRPMQIVKATPPKAVSKPEEVKPREMTRDDRRRIWRAVDEAYDPTNERYGGDATDASIAKSLSLPVAWVEAIRDSDFGPAGANEDMEALHAEIRKALLDLNEAIEGCFKAAEKADEKRKALVDLERRVARVEASVGR